MQKIFFLILFTASLFASEKKETQLYKWLNAITDVEIESLEPDSVFFEKYIIMFTQPLDHKNPDAGKFKQRIFVSHISVNRPTVLITEGYAARYNYTKELSEILNANEVRVEHRYFGESEPDTMDWRYLNLEQAIADYHKIVTLFKEF